MADTGAKEYIAKEKTLQEILGRIGSAGDSGSTTVFGRLNSPKVVKSVQRGAAAFVNTTSERMVVDIAPVDTSKSFINVQSGLIIKNGDEFYTTNDDGDAPNAGRLISSTQIELLHSAYRNSYGVTLYIWWEVVEFY